MAYLVDADVFIRAKNQHYGMDFCPAYWDWLVKANEKKKVSSIEKVGNELKAGDDELATWAKNRKDGFFISPDESTLKVLPTVSAWASTQSYSPGAVSTFLQAADYYLVSQALAGKHTVVTHEVPSGSINRIKIPDACIGLKIKCVTPFEMLRSEKPKFILQKQ